MEFNYIWKLVLENIDSFNLSIIAGIITSVFIIVVDSVVNDIKINHKGFYDDKYRRYQKMRRLIHAIDNVKAVFLLTENMSEEEESIKKLIRIQSLDSIRREYATEVEVMEPYRYFKKMYITDNMSDIISRETDLFSKIRYIINVKEIENFDLLELEETKTKLWKNAFDMRKEDRKEVSFELLRELAKNKYLRVVFFIIITSLIIG